MLLPLEICSFLHFDASGSTYQTHNQTHTNNNEETIQLQIQHSKTLGGVWRVRTHISKKRKRRKNERNKTKHQKMRGDSRSAEVRLRIQITTSPHKLHIASPPHFLTTVPLPQEINVSWIRRLFQKEEPTHRDRLITYIFTHTFLTLFISTLLRAESLSGDARRWYLSFALFVLSLCLPAPSLLSLLYLSTTATSSNAPSILVLENLQIFAQQNPNVCVQCP